MKIYTRKGDRGETSLFGGGRVPKAHARVDAYGTIDELNSVLGWAVTQLADDEIRDRLAALQHDLFILGAELATPSHEGERRRPETPELPADRVETMEEWIDQASEEVEPLKQFVLPGGAPGAAALHVTRTVCRRAERAVVALAADAEVSDEVIRYLNRLSDLLFALARLENHRSGRGDVIWRKEARGGEDG